MPPPGKLSRLVPHDPQICPIGSLTVWLNPGEIPDDGLGGAPGRAPRPPLERLDAEPNHAEVVAQCIGLCSSLQWSRHLTKSPFLALLVVYRTTADNYFAPK